MWPVCVIFQPQHCGSLYPSRAVALYICVCTCAYMCIYRPLRYIYIYIYIMENITDNCAVNKAAG